MPIDSAYSRKVDLAVLLFSGGLVTSRLMLPEAQCDVFMLFLFANCFPFPTNHDLFKGPLQLSALGFQNIEVLRSDEECVVDLSFWSGHVLFFQGHGDRAP
jgi:hypothetical protein